MDLESKEEPFEPSLVKEPVAQSCVLDPLSSSRTLERTVPEYDDADFQSELYGQYSSEIVYLKRKKFLPMLRLLFQVCSPPCLSSCPY